MHIPMYTNLSQTISIMLGPSSKDQDDAYKSEDHGCVNIMKIPINLFDSQKWSEDVRYNV